MIKFAIRFFVAILLLISPIDIFSETVPKYKTLNYDKRKLEENDNYNIAKYGNQTIYDAGQFLNEYRQEVDYIKYEGEKVNLTQQFKIEKNSKIEKIFFLNLQKS